MLNQVPSPFTMSQAEAVARARQAAQSGSAEACMAWEQVRRHFPLEPAGYLEGARALWDVRTGDAAEALLEEGTRHLPGERALWIERAHAAARRGDWPRAADCWESLRIHFPDLPLGYGAGATALRQAGQLDAAEALITAGLAKFHHDSELLFERARLAEARGQWDAACRDWEMVRSLLPDHWVGYLSAIHSLRKANRFEEASAVAEAGHAHHPGDHRFSVEYARLAEAQGNWDEAVRRWALTRARFPALRDGYAGGAEALRRADARTAADTLLAEGVTRLPGDLDLWVAWARMAVTHGDWPEAASRWAAVAARFPDHPTGYLGQAVALREDRRLDDAEPVLAEAVRRFPQDPDLLPEWARIAHWRQDFETALPRWETVLALMPDNAMSYLASADVLRALGRIPEAEDRLRDAMERFPDQSEPALAYARLAGGRPDPAEAHDRWTVALERFPDRLDAYIALAAILRRQQNYDAATAVLTDAVERFPTQWEALSERARGAQRLGTPDEALADFALLRTRFPDHAFGYTGAAQTEMDRGRMAEAEAILKAAMERFPKDVHVALAWTRVPIHPLSRPRSWEEAIRRVDAVHTRFPGDAAAIRTAIEYRRDANRLDEAKTLATAATKRFPDHVDLAVQLALVALARAEWNDAIKHLTAIGGRFPDRVDIPVRLGEALLKAERLDEAETVIRAAMTRFPNLPEPFRLYGQIAARRADWPEAMRRWSEGSQRFPHDQDLAVRIFETRLRLAESGVAEQPESTGSETHVTDIRALLMRFESLGGSGHGCEFGLFQREFGAEPLSLLRWSDLGDTCEGLIAAMQTDFEGIGEPENTLLDLVPSNGRNEYWTKDKRYWMAMRAFIFEDEIPYDKMYVQACRRIRFLRGKLLQDLREDEKIFVYRNMWRDLTGDELARLHAAMRRFGQNWFLYIRFEDAQHPNGTVELRGDGLMIGFIDHFGFSPKDEPLGSASRSFLTLCRAAEAIWQKQQVATAA